MAKPPKPGRRTLDSYTIKRIGKTICPGDCVLMRPADSSNPSYVARVEKIEAGSRGTNVRIHVRWYYRPEESIGGRRPFHGSKELFLSDHFDVQSADTIEGKCTVHSFKNYAKLDAVENDDFFCRFEYNSISGAFNPDRVAVFHPTCMDITPEEAESLDHFYCHTCSSEDQNKLNDSHASTRFAEGETKRRRRG
ncbi:chromatin remodeling protein EBS-like isoform X2 [Andrographis paniculata]|uniref:chromatin remodeling protein EBS-like isoform X2 n=1 Tax=Andrographis paniculata TaxID=175694 RepID=UPI0021E6F3E8|nr:chromatin remodeling protein EBS-like isoform X2 [Andrographis paniculata]